MRQVVLDTETTGLETRQGHRIIEIGAVEIVDRRISERQFHQYINPEREIDEAAEEIHGISSDFLADKPLFPEITGAFLEFVKGAELVIHNAQFDTGFINHEFSLLNAAPGRIEDYCTVLDSLLMARQLHPGQKNNLDALCKRYHIDNSQRTLHGALLDAQILADVYLAMTGGQTSFLSESSADLTRNRSQHDAYRLNPDRKAVPVITANTLEVAAHEQWLKTLQSESDGKCLWLRLQSSEDQ